MTYQTRLQDAREEGHEEGLEQGKLETLAELVRDRILTIDQAASRRSLTVDDFKKQCVKYNLTL